MKQLATALALATAATAVAAQAPARSTCQAPQHRQLDFWVGRWTVTNAAGELAGTNLIESVYAGCGLRETWISASGLTGGSLTMFDRTDGKWKQNWIDSVGGRLDYVGAWDGKAMVLIAREDQDLSRMSFIPLPDRAVRQHIERSSDDGKTWTSAYDFTYRPAAPARP